MSIVGIKRFQTGIFEALATQNRAAGSGGGSGAFSLFSLGSLTSTANAGNFSTANASTWTDITGSSFTISVPRTCLLFYLAYANIGGVSGTGNGYFRGDIVSVGTTPIVSDLALAVNAYRNCSAWLLTQPIQPGAYTAKLQVATDSGETITVNQMQHEIFAVSP